MSGGSEKIKVHCWNCNTVINECDAYFYEFSQYLGEEPIKMELPYGRKYCKDCFEKIQKQEAIDFETYIKLKKQVMFKKACRLMEKQSIKMYDYKEAIEVVENFLTKNPDKFDSSYEVLAAIILVNNRIYSKMQYKIGRYQVDFLLPEIGVVLEIDGERHKHHKQYDSNRDKFIKKELGYGWDIVRIKTEYLDMNAEKLVDAINAVVEYRETNHIPWRKLS